MSASLIHRTGLLVSALFVLTFPCAAQQAAPARGAGGPNEIKVNGAVTTPLVVRAAEMKQMPRATLRVVNGRSNKTEVYEGVALTTFLTKAGLPQGDQIRGPWMIAYVQISAADGYRVIFSLAELDASFLDSEVLIADTLDGAPLEGNDGPFKLIAPRDKRPSRWVRMVESITVERGANP